MMSKVAPSADRGFQALRPFAVRRRNGRAEIQLVGGIFLSRSLLIPPHGRKKKEGKSCVCVVYNVQKTRTNRRGTR